MDKDEEEKVKKITLWDEENIEKYGNNCIEGVVSIQKGLQEAWNE